MPQNTILIPVLILLLIPDVKVNFSRFAKIRLWLLQFCAIFHDELKSDNGEKPKFWRSKWYKVFKSGPSEICRRLSLQKFYLFHSWILCPKWRWHWKGWIFVQTYFYLIDTNLEIDLWSMANQGERSTRMIITTKRPN